MDMDILIIYKALRLPVLVIAMLYITMYVYNKRRKESIESPKYRMLEED